MLFFLVACSSIESSNLTTAGMFARYEVISSGDKTELSASFRAGDKIGSDWVELVGGDTVSATVGGASVALEVNKNFRMFSYKAEITTPEAESTITFVLDRESQDGAPASSVLVPPPFEIESPADGGSFSAADGELTVTWSPSGSDDEMGVSLEGDCIEGTYDSLNGDPGTYTFKSQDFQSTAEEGEATSCEITVSVTRDRDGQVDAALADGSEITATQERSITLAFTPDPNAGAGGCSSTGSVAPSALVMGFAGLALARRRRL